MPTAAAPESAASPYRSKTLAVWLAVLLGTLGLHRLYVHGFGDAWGWLHPVPTALHGRLIGAGGAGRAALEGATPVSGTLRVPDTLSGLPGERGGSSVRLLEHDPDGEARVLAHALWPASGLPIDEVAQAAGTIGYALMCALAQRVPVRVVP
jgi:hypothetical protein